MNPFFFGTADRALYGIHHSPRVRGEGREGVVLCAPFGVEYMRSHRAFRQLTTLLTRSGLHVLRFDYGGTGDSAGDGLGESLEKWRADIRAAVEELQDAAGIDRVALVGLRLGGTLAFEAVSDLPQVDRVVLWDPVVNGDAYLRELFPGDFTRILREKNGRPAGVSGFPLARAMIDELSRLHLDAQDPPRTCRVEMVVSRSGADFDALRATLVANSIPGGLYVVPSEGSWSVGDTFGSALIPGEIIRHVAELVSESGAVRQ